MGPGDRFKFTTCGGWQLGVYYGHWPYTHTVGINLLKFRVEIGLGLPYTDPDFKYGQQ